MRVARKDQASGESTERNAALAEQSAAVAASLQEQSDRLLHAVSAFRIQASSGDPA